MKFYTGIGSRSTPKEILLFMTEIAILLEKKGYILRSGGASGADTAFEKSVKNKEIFLPSPYFNGSDSPLYNISEDAFKIAEKHHPYWRNLKPYTKKLMARNAYQVRGEDLSTLSSFVICYTDDGCEHDDTRTIDTGGTGLAISIASELGIPVFNLKNKKSFLRLKKFVENG